MTHDPATRDTPAHDSAVHDSAAQDAAAVTALENLRFEAMLAGDADALAPLLHDRLGYGHSSAARETRSSLLEKLRAGVLDYSRIDHPIADILLSGDTAVVVGTMTASVRIAGNPVELNGSTISVWVRQGESWRLLAFQPTPIPAAAS